jgi:hypothetical protein
MRINLVAPFAEKDAVKALGARWDAAQKVWYIMDVADLTPFMRWIPNMPAATGSSAAGAAKTTQTQAKGATTKPSIDLTHCGCDVLPWEDCEHTAVLGCR